MVKPPTTAPAAGKGKGGKGKKGGGTGAGAGMGGEAVAAKGERLAEEMAQVKKIY